MTLLDEWKGFCEGALHFDKSHFQALFHEDHTENALHQIFGYFPSQEHLVQNAMRFREAWRNRKIKSSVYKDDLLFQLAMKDLSDKAVAFKEFGDQDLLAIVDIVTPKIVNSKQDFDAAANAVWPNGEKNILLCDYFAQKRSSADETYYALFEAFYGAANSYDLQWYLGAPLIDTDVNFENYLRLWEMGADVALTETNLLIFHPTLSSSND